jgi:hypothetical protein
MMEKTGRPSALSQQENRPVFDNLEQAFICNFINLSIKRLNKIFPKLQFLSFD